MARWPSGISAPARVASPENPLPCPLLPSPVTGKCVELSIRGFVYLAEFFPPVQGQVSGHSYS